MKLIVLAIRRCTRLVGTSPDIQSAVMLLGVERRHVVSTQWGTRKYMSMNWLKNQDMDV